MRHPSRRKIPVKGGVLEPFEGDKSEEVAVLKYIDAWSRMTSTEQLEYVSSLVGRVLVTDSTPGNISHAHFLAAMVADYVKEKNVVLGPVFPGTPAHIDQIPHAEPAPRTQKVAGMRGNTAVKIKKQRHWSAIMEGGSIKLVSRTEPRANRCLRRGSSMKTSMP